MTAEEAIRLLQQLQEEYEAKIHTLVVAGDPSPARVNHAAWEAWQQTMTILKETV